MAKPCSSGWNIEPIFSMVHCIRWWAFFSSTWTIQTLRLSLAREKLTSSWNALPRQMQVRVLDLPLPLVCEAWSTYMTVNASILFSQCGVWVQAQLYLMGNYPPGN